MLCSRLHHRIAHQHQLRHSRTKLSELESVEILRLVREKTTNKYAPVIIPFTSRTFLFFFALRPFACPCSLMFWFFKSGLVMGVFFYGVPCFFFSWWRRINKPAQLREIGVVGKNPVLQAQAVHCVPPSHCSPASTRPLPQIANAISKHFKKSRKFRYSPKFLVKTPLFSDIFFSGGWIWLLFLPLQDVLTGTVGSNPVLHIQALHWDPPSHCSPDAVSTTPFPQRVWPLKKDQYDELSGFFHPCKKKSTGTFFFFWERGGRRKLTDTRGRSRGGRAKTSVTAAVCTLCSSIALFTGIKRSVAAQS